MLSDIWKEPGELTALVYILRADDSPKPALAWRTQLRNGFGTSQRLDQNLRLDPRVLLASSLLQLTQAELEQSIETELNENPALERLQDDVEPISDELVMRVVSPDHYNLGSEDAEFLRSLPNDEGQTEWIDLVVGAPVLKDHLRAELKSRVGPRFEHIADYLVDSLTDTGYLHEPSEEIALATNASIEEVDAAIKALKSCDPPGVGAATVQECLLLQLKGDDTLEGKLARTILRSHLAELASKNVLRLARRFRLMPEVVTAIFNKITELNPFPFEQAHSSNQGRASTSGVQPDLVLTRTETGWTIQIYGPDPNSFAVSRAYRRRATELKEKSSACKDEKRHVAHFAQRAKDFIGGLEQRRHTLKSIGDYLVTHQSGFISTGRYEFLQSLTKSRLALELGVHESTMSRATAGKFVQISTGEVISFEVFFKPALRVQKMIEEILSTENPNSPVSDERIAKLLAKRGVEVARRTVNKYRDRTKLLSSRRRKSA